MYSKILAAVDEHLNSEAAARYAVAAARASGARLYIFHVLGPEERKSAFRNAEEALKRIEDSARSQGVGVEAIIQSGEPIDALSRFVESTDIDLAFAATRQDETHGGPLRRGSLAAIIAAKLPCPVALVRALHMGRMRPREILVPLRGHMAFVSERAEFVAILAKAFGSRAVLFHTLGPDKSLLEGKIWPGPLERKGRVPAPVARFADEMLRFGVEAELRISAGESSDAVTMEAARARTDLIVLGPSGRRGLASLLRPDFVESVLKGAPCDTVVFFPRKI